MAVFSWSLGTDALAAKPVPYFTFLLSLLPFSLYLVVCFVHSGDA